MWKGAVSFGLVNVPVRMYTATSSHDVSFHQVHRPDGGRIKYKRTCDACGEEVGYDEIAKGYESPDGQLVILTDEDLADLPVTASREIEVERFVPAEQIDPMLLEKSYYLEPDKMGVKPYALLREALRNADRMALVHVAIRQRSTLAVLRVRDDVIVLQTMLWPDEVRQPDFDTLGDAGDLRPQELAMASSLVDSMTGDYVPDEFTDDYRDAVQTLISTKLQGGDVTQAPAPAASAGGGGQVVDLLAALQRSVEAAKGRGDATAAESTVDKAADRQAEADEPAATAPKRGAAAKRAPAGKPAAAKATTKTAPAKRATKTAASATKPATRTTTKTATKAASKTADKSTTRKTAARRSA
jgi:DNA end-binding protein Ku